MRLIGVEPVGAPTLKASCDAGRVVTLPAITTRVATMACGRTDESVLSIVNTAVEGIVLVSDAEMLDAARVIWREFGLAVDLRT